MRPYRSPALVLILLVGGSLLSAASPAAAEPVSRAGVAVVDATWHVGASAGQYASDPLVDDGDPTAILKAHGFDPHSHQVRRVPSYGIQSRLTVRALVVEGPDGTRVAFVKNDLYIPQDMLWRRAAQLIEAGDSGVDREHFAMMVSHNHTSPFYSSTTWGPWAFQDGFDLRFFEYYAQRMALAVERAADSLVPVRMGASVSYFDKTHRHSFGPAIADDGSPAGYPQSDNDHDMMVVRFDDISDPANPKPLGILANFGLHPEFLEGNDLVSADYLAPLERMVDRATGAVLIWSQGSVGSAEPERSTYHSIHERLEFTHRDYAQAEYAARLMADVVIDTWRDVERETPETPGRFLPFTEGFPVAMAGRVFPGPISHPYPGVSNCRTDSAFDGRPGVPVAGLPDCERLPGPVDPGVTTDDLQALGIPVPENYSAPSYGSLQETLSVHLQTARLGDLLITVCPCEQWADQTRNVKTRTDRIAGNIWVGYDWSARCTQNESGSWACPDPRNESATLTVANATFQKMRAQVRNDAAGWNEPAYTPWAESEPTVPADIKGNYTHTELTPALGFGMTMTIGMANDYLGYIATYREYQRGDHYRKALTGFGPHSSDYLATRLVQMGGFLKGGPEPGDLSDTVAGAKTPIDQASADARAAALGAAAAAAIPAYEVALPDDGGDPAALDQPEDIERFDAAFFTWRGGSNYTDNPSAVVERQTGEGWKRYGDMSGEVVVTLEFPETPEDGLAPYLQGNQEWRWTAHFEAFSSHFTDLGERPGVTPAGTYRFVVDGRRRILGAAFPYHLESETFEVRPWSGITVEDLRVDGDGRVSFVVGPTRQIEVPAVGGGNLTATIGPIDYPDSYQSPARFIREQRTFVRDPAAPNDPSLFEWYCYTCSFRPWADTGDVASAFVTFEHPDGTTDIVPAHLGEGGRWHTTVTLNPGGTAFVAAGGITSEHGETNGTDSASVTI
ncbi:MAG TPA: neutral/alkaline non-lysosomal ceramidase N-terminal domain-containing protein [Actinomycetota bacterium]